MAGKGQKFKFHGAFKDKSKAKDKEASCPCFILKRKVRKQTRYIVMEKKQ